MLSLNLVNILNICGAAIGIFLTLVIVGRKKTEKGIKALLAALMSMLSLTIITTIGYNDASLTRFYLLLGPCSSVLFAFGPLVYLYTGFLTGINFKLEKKTFIHFLPYILNLIYEVPLLFIFYGTIPGSLFGHPESFTYNLNKVLFVVRMLHLFTYLAYTMVMLYRHRININMTFSNVDKIRLGWLNFVVIAFSTMILNNLLCTFFKHFVSGFYLEYTYIYNSWQTIILMFLGYNGLIQPSIFLSEKVNGSKGKYRQSHLTPELSDEYLNKLMKTMENEKPYIDSSLTLNSLADQLSMPPRYLSQIINEHLDQNFLDFVNRYRIEEVKRQLSNDKERAYSILGIAFSVGFKSKSTFNTVFKKYTNMSPSQYQKNCINN